MVSLKSTLLAMAALVVGIQADYYIDPTSVPLATRKAWCTSEKATCPSICLDFAPGSGKPLANSCDEATLTYGCVCGNGMAPNVSEYSLTLPYYTCVQYQTNCVTACGPTNNECSLKCRQDITCGAQNPTPASTTSTSASLSTSTTTSSGAALATTFDGATPGSTGVHSTSVQTSLTLATIITGLLVAPFIFI